MHDTAKSASGQHPLLRIGIARRLRNGTGAPSRRHRCIFEAASLLLCGSGAPSKKRHGCIFESGGYNYTIPCSSTICNMIETTYLHDLELLVHLVQQGDQRFGLVRFFRIRDQLEQPDEKKAVVTLRCEIVSLRRVRLTNSTASIRTHTRPCPGIPDFVPHWLVDCMSGNTKLIQHVTVLAGFVEHANTKRIQHGTVLAGLIEHANKTGLLLVAAQPSLGSQLCYPGIP